MSGCGNGRFWSLRDVVTKIINTANSTLQGSLYLITTFTPPCTIHIIPVLHYRGRVPGDPKSDQGTTNPLPALPVSFGRLYRQEH
jgi:hypothetical protein